MIYLQKNLFCHKMFYVFLAIPSLKFHLPLMSPSFSSQARLICLSLVPLEACFSNVFPEPFSSCQYFHCSWPHRLTPRETSLYRLSIRDLRSPGFKQRSPATVGIFIFVSLSLWLLSLEALSHNAIWGRDGKCLVQTMMKNLSVVGLDYEFRFLRIT